MSELSKQEFEKQYRLLISSIRTQATPFPRDTTEKKIARVKRAKIDKPFFAATYFPHYIELVEGFREPWKDPSADIDWVKAGFASVHPEFFALTDLDNKFKILAAFRESAKDTLIGKIDVLHKIYCETAHFIAVVAFSEGHAETKVMPIKIEIEHNERLKNDFGDLKGMMKWEQNEFITANGRKVQGFGIGESLRGQENFGHRPDWIILNDIEDPTKSFNNALCVQAIESIKQDKLKSVNAPKWGAILLGNYISKQSIMHELMTGENTGHYVKKIFRALVQNDKKTDEERAIASACRAKGFIDYQKSAWERRHPTPRLLQEQKDDPETFDCEMMMRPRDRKNKKFKDSDFKFYNRKDVLLTDLVCYSYIDPSETEAGDYKSIITVGVPKKTDDFKILVLDAAIRQEGIDWMLNETYRHWSEYRSKIVGLAITGMQLLRREYQRIRNIRKKTLPIHEVMEHENKELRIERLVPLVRQGVILFDPAQGDQGLLIRQLKGFPDAVQVSRGGIGDDGPDALEGCVRMVDEFPAGTGVDYQTVEERQAKFERGAY